jgi:hypothetical protein
VTLPNAAPKPEPRAKADPRTNRIAKMSPKQKAKREAVEGPYLRSSVRPSAQTPKKRPAGSAKAKREREAREFARKYHSHDRIDFVRSLSCFATGQRWTFDDPIDNAHVCDPTKAKGMARKASYLGIAPLKRSAHRLLHDNPEKFRAKYGEFDWQACAAWTEKAWRVFSGQREGGK